MAVNPMFGIGANAIAQGMKGLDSVAQEIAELNIRSNPGSGATQGSFSLDDLAEPIIDLKLYQRQVQAAVKIVETADEVLGFLLDVRV